MMVAGNSAPAPVFHTRLVFDGTAYIDTDVPIPENGSLQVTLGYEATKGTQRIFSADGIFDAYLNGSTNATSRFFSACYGSTSAVVSGTQLSLAWTYNSYGFFLTPKRVGYGTTTKTFTKGANTPTGGLVVGVNSSHTGVPFTGKIMSRIKIFGDDAQNVTQNSDFSNYTPVATLRPCTYLGEAGLWWVEQSRFFGNSAGSGTLTCED